MVIGLSLILRNEVDNPYLIAAHADTPNLLRNLSAWLGLSRKQ